MVYELNNTFEDKDKDIVQLTLNTKVYNKGIPEYNSNYKSENRNKDNNK